MTNETTGGIKRVSWLPDRDAGENGTLIGGQEYDDVYFIGGEITGITPSSLPTPLAIADGGTAATTAQGARTNLLPSQAGNSGYALKTNGTDVLWSADIDTGITQLTGDVTAGPGSGSQAATLATVNSNVGTFGSPSLIPVLTVNGKGLVTAAAISAVTYAASALTGTTLASNVVNSSLVGVATISSGTWQGTAIAPGFGGTGISSYTVGDIIYASGTTTLSKLSDVATGNVLKAGGVGTAPAYGKVVLTADVSGVLAEANGGTNQSTYSQGDMLYASAANTLSKLAKDTNSTRYLSNTGTSNNPAWSQVILTSGVSGTLPVANGGTGDVGSAWTSYTPTVTAGSGTFTTVSATGLYKTLGKTVFVQVSITITTVGTASGTLNFTAPIAIAASGNYVLAGRENATSGKMVQSLGVAGASSFVSNYYDNTSPIGAGNVIHISGVYQSV